MIRALALAFCLIGQASWALAPEVSIRPTARPSVAQVLEQVRLRVQFNPDFRPTARPGSAASGTAASPRREIFLVPVTYGGGGFRPTARNGQPAIIQQASFVTPVVIGGPAVIRPTARPRGLGGPALTKTGVVITQPQAAVTTGKSGKICGTRSIRGEKLSPLVGRLQGCGIAQPVRVTQVAGTPLSKGIVMDCDTAKALDKWVEKGAKPSIGRLGGGLARVDVIAGYSCRTRNSKPGAKVSEHGKGRAVDISGFTLANGKKLTVLEGWKKRSDRKLLKRLHSSACGTFGTVLGPESDRYHQDHFHFDTARHRGGPYCR